MARKSKKSGRKPSSSDSELVADAGDFRRLIHAQGNLFGGLSRNRKFIAPDAIQDIVQNLMRNPIYRNLLAADAFPRAHARVKAGNILQALNPGFEVLWTASILSHYEKELNAYLRLKSFYSSAYLASDFSSATHALDQIEDEFGISLWLTNAQLTLTHVARGIASQKDILNTIVNTSDVDALYAFLAFYLSFSVEESVTLSEIRREFTTSSNIHDYFLYHVSPFDLEAISEPQNCISIESNSPIIDRFETLLDMMLLLYLRKQCVSELDQAITQLSGIDDIRIRSLNYCLSDSQAEPTQHIHFLEACDQYSLGNHDAARKTLSSILTDDPAAAWAYELAARNDIALSDTREQSTIVDTIVFEMGAFLDLSRDLSTVRGTLLKLGFQTRKLLASKAVAALLDRVLDIPISERVSDAQGTFCLSSPLVQPANYALLKRIDEAAFARLATKLRNNTSPAHKIGSIAVSHISDGAKQMQEMSIPLKRASLYLAYGAYNSGAYFEATNYYATYRTLSSSTTSPRTLTFQYALHRRQHHLSAALNAFVEAHFENPRTHSLYAMDEFTSWAVANATVDESAIDRSILLHVFSQSYGSSHDGDLSDSLEDLLDHYNVQTPSQLIGTPLEPRRLNYVLRFVSNIDRLEDTTRFDTLDEIESERITILQWLVQNDSINRNSYTQEISSITKDQEVARLSAQLERSKIYVHEEGLRRTFETEIKPQFFRYRQLLADPGVGAQIDQIEQRIRKLLKESDQQFGYLIIPSTERDSVYFSMIQRAYDIFGLDPNHGLKTYLSTRILHGILEGELRASFVNEGLLVSTDGLAREQEALDRWKDQLSRLGDHDRAEIAKSIVKFSERITEAISILKDKRIRILSKDNPQGLFAIAMSESAFERLKLSVTSTTTYDEFFERLFLSFWESVETSLRDVKLELSGHFRREIANTFDSLEAGLTSTNLETRPIEILDAVARCRTSFAIDLDRVSTWFARAGALSREPFLASTAIRVAARITNNCYPQYPLDVQTSEIGTHEIAGELLNAVVDLLTNCFQNAAEHSGVIDRAPIVGVGIAATPNKDLSFRVNSELSGVIDIEACRSEITELVYEEDVANSAAVAGEGRTGIRKMKRILQHDFQSKEKLEIDVSSRTVTVSFIVPREHVSERSYH